jgi:RNA polymerase sigma-70 factor (ECF subfamily)
VVSAFKDACTSGNLDDLIIALAPEVLARVDGGGNARAALRPLVGADKVARFLLGVIAKRPTCELVERTVNGKNGIVMIVDGHTVGVYSFDVMAGQIQTIWAVVNPDKLDAWND